MDGTDGNHPRYTNIISNLAHEVGHYEKQVSLSSSVKLVGRTDLAFAASRASGSRAR